jgi:hypothetical protein
VRPSRKKDSAKWLWSGLQSGRSTAQDEERRAEMALQGGRTFSAVVGFRLA